MTPEGVKQIPTRQTDPEVAREIVLTAGVQAMEHMAAAQQLSEKVFRTLMPEALTPAPPPTEALALWAKQLIRSGKSTHTALNAPASVARFFRESGCKTLRSVTEDQVDHWVNPEGEAKVATRHVRMARVRSFFDFCLQKGWIDKSPAALVGVRARDLPHELIEPHERQPFTEEEVKALMQATEPGSYLHTLVVFSCETGLRMGDVANLQWSHLRGEMIVWTRKSLSRVQVPITPAMSAALVAVPRKHEVYLFPAERKASNDPSSRMLNWRFKALCKKLGIEGKSAHNLRHTHITEARRAGKSLEEIRKDVGHRSVETTKGYCHVP